MISFGSEVCRNFTEAIKREWYQTNELGGFAASTILSLNTRRDHGLLVASLRPPLGRYVLLSGLDETLYIDDAAYPLSTRIQANTIYPNGFLYLDQCSLEPFPSWIYSVEDLLLGKSVVLLRGEQTVLIRYQILSGDEDLVRLELRPLTAFRHVDDLARRNQSLNTKMVVTSDRITFAGMYFYHNAAIVEESGNWYQHIQYPEDKKVGREFEEDLFAPFRLIYAFGNRRENFLVGSMIGRERMDFKSLLAREVERRARSR
ncbi:MAG: hypothetical protein A3G87_00400 [Omnitrophica bacterium RIFCSPLOWO2_12_FULL_50_11]|nr:MAG: hypothetical protein A3G87_00400 [Omnitrophica bacterium RIFCSPLOWO2_12_FULL_50_11]